MKLQSLLVSTLVAGLVGIFWVYGHHPAPTFVSGQVENQIRGFGAPLAQQLNQATHFERVQLPLAGTMVAGYRPQAEAPHAPAGLLPQEQQAWEAMARREAKTGAGDDALTPFFPEHYSQGAEVHGLGMAVTLKPLGSTSAQAEIENGKIVYHEAYRETDSLQVVSAGQSEEFLLLHSPRAPPRFEYEIAAAQGVKEITLKEGAIHFKNLKGQELQIEAPWLIENNGKKLANQVRWELTPPANGQTWPKLVLVLNDAKSLHYPVVIDPSWVAPLGSLHTARYSHTATLLNSGKVLVAGGANGSALASAELYDPATGTWTTTGSLNFARYSHTATLLANGQVLVVGGTDGSNPLVTAELYDPTTGSWTVTGSLNDSRYVHTATILPNGQVLVAGGIDQYGFPFSVTELYNPATGNWTVTGSLVTGRANHTATLLPNGQVLVAGGAGTSTELYNPSTGLWTATGFLVTARSSQTATLLPNGQVLVAGGIDDSSNVLASAELYNPSTGFWTATGSLNVARYVPTATILPNGQVLLAGGGDNASDSTSTLASVEIYNPAQGTWTLSTSLTTMRSYATATVLPTGQVLVAGGQNSSGAVASGELYDLGQGAFSATGNLTATRVSQTATLLPNGQVLIAGGYNGSQQGYLASAELYNPTTGTWATTGSLHTARYGHTATLLPNGQVLIAGGYNGSYLTSAELYNPVTGTWTVTGSLNSKRRDHTATLLPSGLILIAGGYNGLSNINSAELYDPATGLWTVTGHLRLATSGQTATLLPTGFVLLVGGGNSYIQLYNPANGTWRLSTGFLLNLSGQTATLLPNGLVLFAGGYPLQHSELYDPVNDTSQFTGNTNSVRYGAKATLLPNGQVLLAGGTTLRGKSVPIAEVYNPATGKWTLTSSIGTNFWLSSATLLPNGRVLVAGSAAELYDPGLGYGPAAQPQLNPVSALGPISGFSLTGTGLTGVSGGSVGADSNIPVVQFRSLVNEQTLTLPLDPSQGFSSSSFASLPTPGFVPGYLLATVFVNGIPSASQITSYSLLSQTVTFPAIGGKTYGDPPFSISATASTGLPVTYGLISGPATLSGSTVTITGAGTVVLQAGQAGDGTYAPTTSMQTITVVKAAQTINFPTILSPQYVGTAITLSATASTGLPVTISYVSGPATFSGNVLTFTGTGTVVVKASQAGNANYAAAPDVSQSIQVSPGSQTISFPPLANHTYGDAPFTISATSSAGLPVSFTVASGPATISGNTVTITGAGAVSIQANQPGDVDYNAAPPVSQGFTVFQASQTISFPAISPQPYGAPYTLSATSSSGLPVTFSLNSGPATLSGNVLTFTGVGTVNVTASQPGNANYLAATNVPQSIVVGKASQTITFASIPDQIFGAGPVTLNATASSGLPVAYALVSGPATLSGNVLTLTGVGTVKVTASQHGDANYLSTSQTRSFKVGLAQTITFPAPANVVYPAAPLTLNATASSGLTVSYTVISGPATVSGNTVTLTGPGTVRIEADQGGDATYARAPHVTQGFTVFASQTITFPPISNQIYPSAPLTLNATASSGLPVTYTVLSGPATVIRARVTLTGVGVVRIAADQAGNTSYARAPHVTRAFTVVAAP